MNCIYTCLYTNLKSYDDKDTNIEMRIQMFELCVNSFKKCNPETIVISELIDTPIDNTAQMYFDKMVRIKELNYNYNVLWVDCDTICMQNISELFTKHTSGAFWGHWDGFHSVNGGVIHYKKRHLYDNFDYFCKKWIKVLSENEKFIGPYEQFPITDLILSQINKEVNMFYDSEYLLSEGYLFDIKYNINLVVRRYNEDISVYNKFHSILHKKIIHINSSETFENSLIIMQTLYKLIEKNDNASLLLSICKDEKLSMDNYIIENTNDYFKVINYSSTGFCIIYVFDTEIRDVHHCIVYILYPGHYINIDKTTQSFNGALIKNVYSGEILNI